MAGCVIVFLLVMGNRDHAFTIPANQFVAQENCAYRLEGEIQNFEWQTQRAQLCESDRCIPVEFLTPSNVENGDRAILSGVWQEHRFVVDESLRRCDHRKP